MPAEIDSLPDSRDPRDIPSECDCKGASYRTTRILNIAGQDHASDCPASRGEFALRVEMLNAFNAIPGIEGASTWRPQEGGETRIYVNMLRGGTARRPIPGPAVVVMRDGSVDWRRGEPGPDRIIEEVRSIVATFRPRIDGLVKHREMKRSAEGAAALARASTESLPSLNDGSEAQIGYATVIRDRVLFVDIPAAVAEVVEGFESALDTVRDTPDKLSLKEAIDFWRSAEMLKPGAWSNVCVLIDRLLGIEHERAQARDAQGLASLVSIRAYLVSLTSAKHWIDRYAVNDGRSALATAAREWKANQAKVDANETKRVLGAARAPVIAELAAMALPNLGDGSNKQRDWAAQIRRQVMARWREVAPGAEWDPRTVYDRLVSHTAARWWIDNRDQCIKAVVAELGQK